MTEKRYKSNKYVHCYCVKDEAVLVGAKLNLLINMLFVIPGCMLLCFMILTGSLEAIAKLGLVMHIVLIPTILSWVAYSHAKKEMLKGGHTKYCSRKVAYLAVLYDGIYGDFKIIKEKDD